MLLHCRRRRRVFRIVALLIVACIIVLCFQLFLFGAISGYHDDNVSSGWFDRGARPKYAEDDRHLQRFKQRNAAEVNVRFSHTTPGCDDKNCSETEMIHSVRNQQEKAIVRDNQGVIRRNVVGLISVNTSSFADVWQYLELGFPLDGEQFVTNVSVLGANSRWKHAYLEDADGFFTCILSKEKIPFSNVNDDFCDCSDHSDEPGTSACSSGRFYCSFQSSWYSSIPKWLPSSRVNDGLCDCCDGSDEWANHTLPNHILHRDKNVAHYNVYQTPCVDRCEGFRLLETKLAESRKRGLAVKEDYIKAGLGQSNPNNLYGPDAVFYKLSTICLNDVRSGKYTYTICPFGPVKQNDSGRSVLIGQSPRWLEQGPAAFRLLLSDGDSTNCPGSDTRKTTVIFECGIEDHVVSVSENEVCQYVVRFTSPAAC